MGDERDFVRKIKLGQIDGAAVTGDAPKTSSTTSQAARKLRAIVAPMYRSSTPQLAGPHAYTFTQLAIGS